MADYVTTTITQIANLLGSNPWFAQNMRPGNRLFKLSGIRWPEKPRKTSGDYPSFEIDANRNDVVDPNAEKTFANTTGQAGDSIVVKTINFQLVFTWDSLDRNKPNILMSILEGMLLKDRTLGIPAALRAATPASTITIQASGRFIGKTTEEKTSTTSDTKRLVQRIDFPITYRLRQADLIAAAAYTGA